MKNKADKSRRMCYNITITKTLSQCAKSPKLKNNEVLSKKKGFISWKVLVDGDPNLPL